MSLLKFQKINVITGSAYDQIIWEYIYFFFGGGGGGGVGARGRGSSRRNSILWPKSMPADFVSNARSRSIEFAVLFEQCSL